MITESKFSLIGGCPQLQRYDVASSPVHSNWAKNLYFSLQTSKHTLFPEGFFQSAYVTILLIKNSWELIRFKSHISGRKSIITSQYTGRATFFFSFRIRNCEEGTKSILKDNITFTNKSFILIKSVNKPAMRWEEICCQCFDDTYALV